MPDIFETTDAAASTSTTYGLSVGQKAQGTLNANGDHDWFSVNLAANQTYTFAMVGTGVNNVQDTFLNLYAADGVTLAASNDDGLPRGSVFSYTTTTAGTYYLDAGAFDNIGAGQYGVSVATGSRASFDTQMGAGVIDSGYSWSATAGTGATVTYAFRQTDSRDEFSFSQLSDAQQSAVKSILAMYSEVCGLDFRQIQNFGSDYSDDATMLFSNYRSLSLLDGTSAYAYTPGSTLASSRAGDVYLNTQHVSTTSLEAGSYSHSTIIHEIGHAVGLLHPGLYLAGSGEDVLYGTHAQFTQDSNQYSIMSYFDESNTGAGSYASDPDTLMLMDVYALQQIYGANMSTRSGDTVYGFNSNAGGVYDFSTNSVPALTIWDGGGTDTLNVSGFTNSQVVNLVSGSFSNIGGRTGNVSIALGAVIENAIGGAGGDTFYLSNSNISNLINGGSGSDTVYTTYSIGSGYTIQAGSTAANFVFLGSAGTDSFQNIEYLGFADGTTISTAALFSTPVNRAPAVTVQNVGVGAGQSIAASSMIASASDPDAALGDAITKYAFKDLGSGGGYFTVNGVTQGSGQWIEVAAANLATLRYVGGSTAASETFQVGVHDGDVWSATVAAVATTTGSAVVNRAPVVAVQNVAVSAGQSIAASSMIASASDPDAGDAVNKYAFKDLGSGGGYFTVNGSAQASGQWIEVAAANLATLRYVGGSTAASETFQVGVHDGDVWSPTVAAVATTTGSAVANRAPVVAVQNVAVSAGQSIAASSMIASASDPDAGDAVTKYAFKDLGSGGGYFTVNGSAQASGQWVEVAAANLATLRYVGGSTAASETFQVGVHDGDAWSPTVAAVATTTGSAVVNRAPVVAVQNVAVSAGQSIAASSMIASASDPDAGDAVTKYAFKDLGSGGGYFTVNGSAQASGQWVEVAAANLATLRYVGGSTAASETFQVGVHDGDVWSPTVAAVATTTGSAVANRAPTVSVQNFVINAGLQFAASSMITAASDPDAGDSITKYAFKDLGNGGGYFTVGGVAQAANQWIEVAAGSLASIAYVGGSSAGSETIYVGAHDGDAWSPSMSLTATTFLLV